ncbi:hypothetical protein LOC68_13710 [Blastopirellula sp. JC732]|uniref:Uncharacterized protein n=1 Tax=Blastopirellula sediminis TaxID=2894196 RepID=A0A9X1MMC1_9BACT|nr:hypothetical protein [Blastopirellula sediminis]MCC9607256.1 hypothetical protein [Blastopirellula sediminis]MCC9629451.1 hypothetical protein [Blastopirellula sediminis]
MRISPDFLELEHVDFRVRQSWLAIDSVSHVDHALVITYPLERYYIIEDRHFVAPEAAREFAAAAHAYHAAARDIPTMDDSFLPEWTHDDQRFSVTYSNVATDWTGAMKSVGISRKTIYDYGVAFLFWAASNGLLAYLSYFDFGQRLKSGVITPFHALQQFALVAVILVFAYGTSFAMLMLVREVINRWRVPATLLTKRTVEITPRGVVERSPLSIVALRWPAVGQVSFPFKLIHIRDLQQKSAIRIPFDAFPGLAQASDFSAHVDGWKRRDDLTHEEEKDSLPLAPMPDDENPYRSPQT